MPLLQLTQHCEIYPHKCCSYSSFFSLRYNPQFTCTRTNLFCWWAFGKCQDWAIVNHVLLNILVYVFCWTYKYISLGYMPRIKLLISFKLIRKCQIIFQSSCANLLSHKQCRKVPVTPYPCLVVSLFCFSQKEERWL